MEGRDWVALSVRASQVFSPAAPIQEKDLFAGRTEQLNQVIDAINQHGQHALIYGERGVGKTSLANVLAGFLESAGRKNIIPPHVNCVTGDDFASLWRKVFESISLLERRNGIGFRSEPYESEFLASEKLGKDIGPGDIVKICATISGNHVFIPIIDELDRLTDSTLRRYLTDTIKALSDQVPGTTVVLVGVSDTVGELIEEHGSVERALVQVRTPRMSSDELRAILDKALGLLGMEITGEAMNYIAGLSQGLPHYTHLLGLHSARAAIAGRSTRLELAHVNAAVRTAIVNAQQTLQQAYHRAVMSQRPEALYKQVLLAAALADPDELGYFANADVRSPMSKIMGRLYDIPSFSQHLSAFCEPSRGPVLERVGQERNYRYRFRNPLLQPFVIMQGLSARLISEEDVKRPQARGGRSLFCS